MAESVARSLREKAGGHSVARQSAIIESLGAIVNYSLATLLILGCLMAVQPGIALGDPFYFLVSESTHRIVHGDSYVISLTNAQQIIHARALIKQGRSAGSPIVFATIADGADNTNRDHLQVETRVWSWHVTQVNRFGDTGIELLDGWPGLVETNVLGWMHNTGARIGFWNYTVTAELPLRPHLTAIMKNGGGIDLSMTALTPPFPVYIEMATNLATLCWRTQTQFLPQFSITNYCLPTPPPTAFFRLGVTTDQARDNGYQ